MDFLYRRVAPRYKGIQPQAGQGGGLLSGLRTSLLGSGTPLYRTAGRGTPRADAGGRAWWQAVPATPQYRDRPLALELDCTPVAHVACVAEEAEAPCEEDISDGVPTEIHIW